MKIAAIIQARMGSTRLSGKVLKEIKGRSVLSHVIERVKQSTLINEIVIATTVNDRDTPIEKEAHSCGIKIFRGNEEDVLSRYYLAARENNIDVIVRITSDCPLIDAKIIDDIIDAYLKGQYDIVTNATSDQSQRTYPRGLDTEVFSFEALENAYNNNDKKYHKEHVTPYIYENSDNQFLYQSPTDYSKHRWTLDTEEDFKLISEIYKKLYNNKHNFYLADIVALFEQNPELFTINSHIEQKKIQKN